MHVTYTAHLESLEFLPGAARRERLVTLVHRSASNSRLAIWWTGQSEETKGGHVTVGRDTTTRRANGANDVRRSTDDRGRHRASQKLIIMSSVARMQSWTDGRSDGRAAARHPCRTACRAVRPRVLCICYRRLTLRAVSSSSSARIIRRIVWPIHIWLARPGDRLDVASSWTV